MNVWFHMLYKIYAVEQIYLKRSEINFFVMDFYEIFNLDYFYSIEEEGKPGLKSPLESAFFVWGFEVSRNADSFDNYFSGCGDPFKLFSVAD